MNDPVQKPWNDVTPGDIVSPGQPADNPPAWQWFRVTGKTGNAVDLHGPITPQDLTAGQPIPGTSVDLAAPVWVISTTPAPAPAAAPAPTPSPEPAPAAATTGATALPDHAELVAGMLPDHAELVAGMVKLAKQQEAMCRELSALFSGAGTALAAIARKGS